jgi:PhnB protein
MNVAAYITTQDCNGAIEFYKKAFNAVENSARILDDKNRIGHTTIEIGETTIHISDEHPELDILGPLTIGNSPVRFILQVDDVDTVFNRALEVGAEELMPVEDQFYGERSGRLRDPSGHIWIISTTIEELSDAELKERTEGPYHVEETD